jgi:hypothetical protein
MPGTQTDPLTPEQRSLRARIAAHEKWAQTSDPTAATDAARRAFADRFTREVDPNNELPPAERERRAAHARKAYYTRLAFASAKARRAKRLTPEAGAA